MTNPTPPGSSNPLAKYAIRELTGHRKKIYSLAWSPNGKKLASGSSDTAIRIWSLEAHNQVSKVERAEAELKGHGDYVTAVQWKPSNTASHSDVLASIASTDKDKSVRFWDVRSCKCTNVLNMSAGGNVSLAWSPDGNSLAVANNKENSITFVDVRKNKVARCSKVGTEPFKMQWGPTSAQLMFATNDGTVNVYALPDMTLMWSLKGHQYSCYTFAVDRDHQILASGGGDALVSIWDLANVACVRTITRMDGPVKDLSLSRDGALLAYASEPMPVDPGAGVSSAQQFRGVVEIVSTKTGELLQAFNLKGSAESVAWNPEYPVLAFTEEKDDVDSRGNKNGTTGSIMIYAPPKQ